MTKYVPGIPVQLYNYYSYSTERDEDMQHAVRESASDSFSLPPWTIIGREVRRAGVPQPTLKHCAWQSGRDKHNMSASRF